jgi:polysaccharide pyruvyl transferase WcaK-like protein
MKILVIAMPGAGNFGDDLISVCLVDQLQQHYPDQEIGLLVNEETIHLPYSQEVYLLKKPRIRLGRTSYQSRSSVINSWIKTADIILIGGGGLFQDTHFTFTIYRYLRFALRSSHAKVIGVGLGIGPIKRPINRWFLRQSLDRFSSVQVRDHFSAELLRSISEIRMELEPDIVLGADLKRVGIEKQTTRSLLGCSLRPWKDFSAQRMANMIQNICSTEKLDCAIFVFEYAEENQEEFSFAKEISGYLQEAGVNVEIHTYNKTPINTFLNALGAVKKAIAVRYHANIIWQKMGVPVFPLSYAPKVTSLYLESLTNDFQVVKVDQLDKASVQFYRLPLEKKYHLPELESLPMAGRKWKHVWVNTLFFCLDFADRIRSFIKRRF